MFELSKEDYLVLVNKGNDTLKKLENISAAVKDAINHVQRGIPRGKPLVDIEKTTLYSFKTLAGLIQFFLVRTRELIILVQCDHNPFIAQMYGGPRSLADIIKPTDFYHVVRLVMKSLLKQSIDKVTGKYINGISRSIVQIMNSALNITLNYELFVYQKRLNHRRSYG